MSDISCRLVLLQVNLIPGTHPSEWELGFTNTHPCKWKSCGDSDLWCEVQNFSHGFLSYLIVVITWVLDICSI
jgi:hypothetical protein